MYNAEGVTTRAPSTFEHTWVEIGNRWVLMPAAVVCCLRDADVACYVVTDSAGERCRKHSQSARLFWWTWSHLHRQFIRHCHFYDFNCFTAFGGFHFQQRISWSIFLCGDRKGVWPILNTFTYLGLWTQCCVGFMTSAALTELWHSFLVLSLCKQESLQFHCHACYDKNNCYDIDSRICKSYY